MPGSSPVLPVVVPGTSVASTAPVLPAPRVVSLPPGFVLVEVGRYRFMCEPVDQDAVRTGVAQVAPTTRPTTMPADLMSRISERQDELVKQIVKDLALSDDTKPRALFEERLIPMMRRLGTIDTRSPMVYLVTTRKRLIVLLKSGAWSDPALYYNRAADDVAFDLALTINPERDFDDTLVPVLYDDKDDAETRQRTLVGVVQTTDRELTQYASTSATLAVHLSFVGLVGDDVIKPMKFKLDQDWFGMGMIGVLASKYTSQITGVPQENVISAMTNENPRAPVRASSIDLLNPVAPQDLNPRFARPYIDALGRRATQVVYDWVKQVGDENVTKTLTSLQSTPAADGPALVARIREITGADLTSKLGAEKLK